MKTTIKILLVTVLGFLFAANVTNAQWTTTGINIYNTNTGNVGIGLGSLMPPQSKLHVKGDVLLDYGCNLYLGDKNNANKSGLRLTHWKPGSSYIIARTEGAADLDGLIFRVDALGTGNNERMRINANGYVGIGGVTSPWCKTHINGDLFVTGTGKNNVTGTASIFLGDNNTQPQFGIEYEGGGLNFWKPFGSTNGTGGNGFGNALLFIKDNGNVGIGTSLTSNPNNYKLAVNGIIGAKAITIEITSTTWSDFVFGNNYKLKSLPEVEKYIKEYQHLPGVPSGKEIEKTGLEVGELLKLQMQKIEELTLYIIEQNKRIEALEKRKK